MKYILGVIATALMIWSLLDKENSEYKIYIQVVSLALFFYVLMKLMNKMPSNYDKSNSEQEKKDENDRVE